MSSFGGPTIWGNRSFRRVMIREASSTESVVQDCIVWLKDRYGATVEDRVIREEDVYFPLPKELRVAAQS